ncbi:cell death regulator Aven-like [Passer montanus]|uniref:cell death regulator Aven-like n=1 Tax=Passer montanus TaxID=9160 RepID=UPI00195F6421|nr:cell death regulator Aven-like [Passer montanus]
MAGQPAVSWEKPKAAGKGRRAGRERGGREAPEPRGPGAAVAPAVGPGGAPPGGRGRQREGRRGARGRLRPALGSARQPGLAGAGGTAAQEDKAASPGTLVSSEGNNKPKTSGYTEIFSALGRPRLNCCVQIWAPQDKIWSSWIRSRGGEQK